MLQTTIIQLLSGYHCILYLDFEFVRLFRFGTGVSYVLIYSSLLVKLVFLISLNTGVYLPALYQVYFLPFTRYTSCPISGILSALYQLYFLPYTRYTFLPYTRYASCPIPGILSALCQVYSCHLPGILSTLYQVHLPALYNVYLLPYTNTALYNLFFLLYTSYTSCPIPGIFPVPYKEDVYYLVMSFLPHLRYNSCLVLIIKIHLSIYIRCCLINVWFGLKPAGPRIKKNLEFYRLFRLILPVEQNINHF